jgi:hypothetical protein
MQKYVVVEIIIEHTFLFIFLIKLTFTLKIFFDRLNWDKCEDAQTGFMLLT